MRPSPAAPPSRHLARPRPGRPSSVCPPLWARTALPIAPTWPHSVLTQPGPSPRLVPVGPDPAPGGGTRRGPLASPRPADCGSTQCAVMVQRIPQPWPPYVTARALTALLLEPGVAWRSVAGLPSHPAASGPQVEKSRARPTHSSCRMNYAPGRPSLRLTSARLSPPLPASARPHPDQDALPGPSPLRREPSP